MHIQKFNFTTKEKNTIQKTHLNFKIRVKQKLKFEFYFLFSKKLFVFKGNLGYVTDQISSWA